MPEAPYRAGFAALVGRPNAGKSTLTNALVGEKVAITSSKPQTTRHTVRGIVTTPAWQLILVDTPGLHKPRTLLGERLNDVVRETLLDVDVVGFCITADQRVGPGDQFIARELAELQRAKRTPVVAIVTKSDRVDRRRLAEQTVSFTDPTTHLVYGCVARGEHIQLDVRVTVYVERDSQKAIVIGRGGSCSSDRRPDD